jgi:hypothetical protein
MLRERCGRSRPGFGPQRGRLRCHERLTHADAKCPTRTPQRHAGGPPAEYLGGQRGKAERPATAAETGGGRARHANGPRTSTGAPTPSTPSGAGWCAPPAVAITRTAAPEGRPWSASSPGLVRLPRRGHNPYRVTFTLSSKPADLNDHAQVHIQGYQVGPSVDHARNPFRGGGRAALLGCHGCLLPPGHSGLDLHLRAPSTELRSRL